MCLNIEKSIISSLESCKTRIEMEDSTIFCSQCKAKVSVRSVKANKTGTDWICMDCYNKEHKLKAEPQKPAWIKEEPKEDKKERKYYCTKCTYAFTKTGLFYGKCPYCGRENTVKMENKGADWIEDFLE